MGVALLLKTLCFMSLAMPLQSRLVKRIAYGFPLRTQHDYETYHFISMRKMWGCVTDQTVHELGGCLEGATCAGTLFHPEFVITAAHCESYEEFYLREKSAIYDKTSVHLRYRPLPDEKGKPDGEVKVEVVNPRIIHEFYSTVALLAGSVDYYGSEQKRHSSKIFPHPDYAGKARHDVALIQACQPFEITENVRLAPMMPLFELTTQFEDLVKRSAACLYVGFGDTDDKKTEFRLPSGHTQPTEYLRYTWRKTSCPHSCYINNKYKKRGERRDPCYLCADYIPPRLGTTMPGDSGGPIVCDGYFVGLIRGSLQPLYPNLSLTSGYPMHCIKRALTPDRLEYYRNIPPGGKALHPLGPVQQYKGI